MKKSVLAIHDLSCHAASSLSVVLPLLLAAGLDTSFLPSALLSSQSDGFDNLFVRDLSRECDEIMERWKSYSLHFDCLYTGYLASESQLELVLRARSSFLSPSALIVTDPVMGDEGKLYQNLGSSHIAMMKSLCRGSSVITPNYTEALLLAGRSDGYTAETTLHEAEELATRLSSECTSSVVITSIPLSGGIYANLACDGTQVRAFTYENLHASYPGCGDMFASLLVAFLLNDESFFVSVHKAGEIASYAIRETLKEKKERREGVSVSYAVRRMLEMKF